MRLRPELVLLQKTMVTVEGVARRIDPEHDIWAAADPVVRRWMGRELSPAARVRALVKDGGRILQALSRLADPPPPVVVASEPPSRALWFALGAAVAGLAFAMAAWLR